ncbi:Radical SAM domain protein [Ammonifex degensii KC4]|uniref:Radical SAM domain protein n=1 Tax=Ammonifex degensii (strain DSM 10501 / KC4) TaxID=429009 RepID=C9R9Q6_AMMDK|nr:radical SAM protein [Ammonifex degensii]ACX53035.1 Radical SAM domain protein [Ammonifex degensii KC4]
MDFTPAYKRLSPQEFSRRIAEGFRRLRACDLCPRRCGVNRLRGEKGICRAGREVVVSSYGPHFGEESPLVGLFGSGTIFFTYCPLKCVYCQNYEISQLGEGSPVSIKELARIMLRLQARGCHNINLVTPTHFVPHILAALYHASKEGLAIPIVYNTSGYESLETLALLDGIVDIYMPDFKYADSKTAAKYSGVRDYPEVAKAALKEMQRQVGDLEIDERGLAVRGLLVRHLVLPENLAGTEEVMDFLSQEVSPRCFVNVMGQYYPAYRAHEFPPLNRRITLQEYRTAIEAALKRGLRVYRD